jgi:hypothetical protein
MTARRDCDCVRSLVGTIGTGPLDRIEAGSGPIISHNYLYEAAPIVLYDEEAHTAYRRFRSP